MSYNKTAPAGGFLFPVPHRNSLLLLSGLLLFLAGCTFIPTSVTGPVTDELMLTEFAIAKSELDAAGKSYNHSITPAFFHITPFDGVFRCGEVEANGCFSTGGPEIKWNTFTPTVLRHEFGHGILWASSDPNWACWQHDDC